MRWLAALLALLLAGCAQEPAPNLGIDEPVVPALPDLSTVTAALSWSNSEPGWASWRMTNSGASAIDVAFELSEPAPEDVLVAWAAQSENATRFFPPFWILRGETTASGIALTATVDPREDLVVIMVNPEGIEVFASVGWGGPPQSIPSAAAGQIAVAEGISGFSPTLTGTFAATAQLDHPEVQFVAAYSIVAYPESVGVHRGAIHIEHADGTVEDYDAEGQSVPFSIGERRSAMATFGQACQPAGLGSINHSFSSVRMEATVGYVALLGQPFGPHAC